MEIPDFKENWPAIGLLIVSLLLMVGLLLPWMQFQFSWGKASSAIRGQVQFNSNGLGIGTFKADFFARNRSTNEIVYNRPFTLTTIIPYQLVGGILILGCIIVNILIAIHMFTGKLELLNELKERWEQITLIEAGIILSFLFLFTSTYFSLPISLTLSNPPGSYPSNFTNLQELYSGTFSYFNMAKGRFNIAKISWNREIAPGRGIYITFIGALGLLYLWFINYMRTHEWPDIWKKRGILLPLLGAFPLIPVAYKVSRTKASTLGMLIPFNIAFPGGYLYISCLIALMFSIYRAATLERKIDETSNQIYTMDNPTTQEVRNLRNQIETLRQKAAKYRKILIPILFRQANRRSSWTIARNGGRRAYEDKSRSTRKDFI